VQSVQQRYLDYPKAEALSHHLGKPTLQDSHDHFLLSFTCLSEIMPAQKASSLQEYLIVSTELYCSIDFNAEFLALFLDCFFEITERT